jgi:hypothetical protein
VAAAQGLGVPNVRSPAHAALSRGASSLCVDGQPETCDSVCAVPVPQKIFTPYVERQNLTMRMAMWRFTRLTNAFSKKLANLKAALALHFAHYNFVRLHRSLRVTPAMEAGITNHIWTWRELLLLGSELSSFHT